MCRDRRFLNHGWTTGTARRNLNAATVAPLFTRTATLDQANALAATVRRRLLAPDGFATSERWTNGVVRNWLDARKSSDVAPPPTAG